MVVSSADSLDAADGGSGQNTLSFAAFDSLSGVSLNLASSTATNIGSFSGFSDFVGGAGDDTIIAPASSTGWTVDGGAGTDTLTYAGQSGAVAVNLNTGTATNLGGISNIENVIGGSGNDTVTVSASFTSGSLDGGGGTNTLSFAAQNGVTVDLQNHTATHVTSFANFTDIVGSGGDDLFYAASSGPVTIAGGLGDDTLSFANVSSSIQINLETGTSSNGTSFTGIENLVGGSGHNTFNVSSTGSIHFIDGGAGQSTLNFSGLGSGITYSLATGVGTHVDGSSNIDSVIGSSSADSITGSAGNDSINGNGGNDTINAGGGDDFILLGTGSSHVDAGDGNDFVDATTASATVSGGAGSDTIDVGLLHNESVDGGSGFDVVDLEGNRADWTITHNIDGTYSLTHGSVTDTLSSIEKLYFSGDSTSVYLNGGGAAGDVYGGGEAASIWVGDAGGANAMWTWQHDGVSANRYDGVTWYDSSWDAIGAGNINSDGHADVWFHNSTTGELWYWNLTSDASSVSILSQGSGGGVAAADWTALAATDLNGDGVMDILWQGIGVSNAGEMYAWFMDPSSGTSIGTQGQIGSTNLGASYSYVGAANIDHVGLNDLVFADNAGHIQVWNVDANSNVTQVNTTVGSNWTIEAVADFSGSGTESLVMFDASTHEFRIQALKTSGSLVKSYTIFSPDNDYTFEGVGDYNGDGKADLMLGGGQVGASNTHYVAFSTGNGTFADPVLVGSTDAAINWHTVA